MTFDVLREAAHEANLLIARHSLAILTWGNASAFDAETNCMAIKPSGVAYEQLLPADLVVIDVETGGVVEGESSVLRPSSDTPTHLALYRAFGRDIGGIVHTHSPKATAWAQAGVDLPCYGTTHADHFFGNVPCTSPMSDDEIHGPGGYEANTGVVIVRELGTRGLSPVEMPAVLVHGHAPFVWGGDAFDAIHNAVALEAVAAMALDTLMIRAEAAEIAAPLLHKHFRRKHGTSAYYGQAGVRSREA